MKKNRVKKWQNAVGLKRKREESASPVKQQKIQLRERSVKRSSLLMALDKTSKLLRNAKKKFDETDESEDSLTSDADSDVDPAWNLSKKICVETDDEEEDDNDNNDLCKSSENFNSVSKHNSVTPKKSKKDQCLKNRCSSISSSNLDQNNSKHLTSTSSSHDNDTNDNLLSSSSSSLPTNNKTIYYQPCEVSPRIPAKRGGFVVLKNEFFNSLKKTPEYLWFVKGKSLLQKYKQCSGDNCGDMYESAVGCVGWIPSQYELYCRIPNQLLSIINNRQVKINKSDSFKDQLICYNDKIETERKNSTANEEVKQISCTINVKYEQNNLKKNNAPVSKKTKLNNSSVDSKASQTDINCTFITNINNDNDNQNKLLRTNFDVYIQSLVSLVFDSNFLENINCEHDKFFLDNIHAIDRVTQSLITDVESLIMRDKEKVHTLIKNYLCIEVCSSEALSPNNVQLLCVVCGCRKLAQKQQKFVEFSLYGLEYDFLTLKSIHKTSKIILQERVHCCHGTLCMDKLVTLHRLVHLKYRLYQECRQKVNQKTSNKNKNEILKNTYAVLNEILSNDEWIDQLFHIVQDVWSRAKKLVQTCDSAMKVPSSTSLI